MHSFGVLLLIVVVIPKAIAIKYTMCICILHLTIMWRERISTIFMEPMMIGGSITLFPSVASKIKREKNILIMTMPI